VGWRPGFDCWQGQIPRRDEIAQSGERLSCGLEAGVRLLARARFFFSVAFRPALGPIYPPTEYVQVALYLELERQEREADHSNLVPRSLHHTSLRGAC
jgi:hypothetical protein